MEPEFALCFEGRLSQELAAEGAPVHMINAVRVRHPISIWRARRQFAELLVERRFDVVVCHMAWAQAIFGPVARSARVPLVFWMHLATDGRHWLERWAQLTPPVEVVAPSRFAAGTSAKIYAGACAQTVYYPVAPPCGPQTDRLAVREGLNTPAQAVVIIQASRLEVWKGHRVHLQALGKLRELPDWVCWLAGGVQRPREMRYLEELRDTALQLGIGDRVRFLGERSDVGRLLAAANIYCQPNTGTEGLPIVFTEALYAGLPVVSTAIGGFWEIIDDSCGVLVPPGDADALAAWLRRLIEDRALRAKFAAGGPARARELCDPAAQMVRLNGLLTRAASQWVQ